MEAQVISAGRSIPRDPPGNGQPPLTLFMVHHAGGSAPAYLSLARALPTDWDVRLLELPGRGRTSGVTTCANMGEVLDTFLPLVNQRETEHFALWGHSMGGLIAYETAHAAAAAGHPPLWLGVSASVPPQSRDPEVPEGRDHDDLAGFARELGGTPEEILAIPDIAEHLLGILRADLRIVDSYRMPEHPPLDIPLSLFSGTEDPMAAPDQMDPWTELHSSTTSRHAFSGGHFYFFESVDELALAITGDVLASLPGSTGEDERENL
jgi:surfactin synthase thioesterase subunit